MTGPVTRAFFIALLLILPATGLADRATEQHTSVLTAYVYWGEGCPVCDQQKPFLQDLAEHYPALVVVMREVWRDRERRAEFRSMAIAHGTEARSVPTVFLGGRVFVGDSPALRKQMVAHVERCLEEGCPDSGELAVAVPAARDAPYAITLPLLGTIDLSLEPLFLSTALIALIDGFNPCSLWVLTVLLALVVRSGSRRRILLVGITFLVTTATVYGLFIAGVFSVFAYVAYLGWIQSLVGLLALAMGGINVKDYFWFQRGVSLTIPAGQKPGIYRRMRGLLSPDQTPASLVAATFIMALGIALVELPCTAGFPVLWSAIVAEQSPGASLFLALLLFYVLIYLLIELIVFLGALRSLSIARFEERQGRVLKLVGGMIMIALGLVLLIAPEIMNRIDQFLLVFAAALAAAGAVVLVQRMVVATRPL
jgi:cytochrome c biogenesis protein CcdA/glutaredoxin